MTRTHSRSDIIVWILILILIGLYAILLAIKTYQYASQPVFFVPEFPSATLQIQGDEQKGYVWKGDWSLRVKKFEGIIQTSNKALVTASPFSSTLRFTKDEPLSSIRIQAVEAAQLGMPREESHGGESYFWEGELILKMDMRKSSLLTLTKDLDLKSEQTFILEFKRGLYVINIGATWKNGAEVCYAFLIDVK
jgi:hypothetical protein